MNRTVAATLLVAVLLGSGCVGGDGDSSRGALSGGVADGSSGVRGSVISDELFPVIGANVSTADGRTATTDTAGTFELALPPGEHELNVTAEGYEPATLAVEVLADVFVEVRVLMTGIPGKAPYRRSFTHIGFDACNAAFVYSAGPFPGGPCPFGTPSIRYRVEVAKEWAAGVHELDWLTSEQMAFASAVSTSNRSHGLNRDGCAFTTVNGQTAYDWCPALIFGKAPLRIFARPNDTGYAKQFSINGRETWPGGENYTSRIFSSYAGYGRQEINGTFYPVCSEVNAQVGFPRSWGCPFGVGYSTGVRITYYHTTFYLQPPAGRLEDFSAMPDG